MEREEERLRKLAQEQELVVDQGHEEVILPEQTSENAPKLENEPEQKQEKEKA
jgi:hypothetical protein